MYKTKYLTQFFKRGTQPGNPKIKNITLAHPRRAVWILGSPFQPTKVKFVPEKSVCKSSENRALKIYN